VALSIGFHCTGIAPEGDFVIGENDTGFMKSCASSIANLISGE